MATIGETLRQERKKRGFRLEDVAEALKISYSHLSLIERNKRPNPSITLLKKLGDFYSISLDQIAGQEDGEQNCLKLAETTDNNQIISNNVAYTANNAVHTESNVFHLEDIKSIVNKFYRDIKDHSFNGDNVWLNGTLADDNTVFYISLSKKMVYLKTNKFSTILNNLFDNIWGKPIAEIERLECCLHEPIKAFMLCWNTLHTSKIEAAKHLTAQIYSHEVLTYKILDPTIEDLL